MGATGRTKPSTVSMAKYPTPRTSLIGGRLLHDRHTNRPVGAGWSSPVARQAHNLKVVGSNPTPATTDSFGGFSPELTLFSLCSSAWAKLASTARPPQNSARRVSPTRVSTMRSTDVGGFGHRVWRAQRLAISCAAKPFASEFVSRVWATLPSRSNIRTAGGVVFCTTFATENLAFDPFRIDIIGFAAPF